MGDRPTKLLANSGKGRPKGVPNKITAGIKAAIQEALENAGGVTYLTKLAKTKPAIFCGLVGKIIPTTVVGDPDNPVAIQIIERRIVRPQHSDA